MLGDIYQSVKATLYDRVSSPLWGAFSISWVAWNHRMLIVLFSSQLPDQKFWYIGEYLYPDWDAYALYWVGAPFLTAVMIIGVIPPFGELAYRVSRFWKVRLKKAKLEYDGKTPMSQDEVNQIIFKSAEEKRNLETDIATAIKATGKIEEEKEALKTTVLDLTSNLEEARGLINRLKQELEDKPSPPITDEQLRQILTNNEFTIIHNAEHNRSKTITFNADGAIGKGGNQNEFRWDIDSGDLLIFTEKDQLQNRFVYVRETGGFKAADDEQVVAPPNQSILLLSSA